MAAKQDVVTYYVSLDGKDTWSGMRATANRGKTDGPFATVHRAQRAARKHLGKKDAPEVRIELRGGTHFLKKPLALDPKDSGWFCMRRFMTPEVHRPLVFAAYKDEKPVLSGGRAITGWKVSEHKGKTVWTAKLPSVRKGQWHFRQLWVNGERRSRPQLPKKGEYQIAALLDANWEGSWAETVRKGTNRFGYAEGDLDPAWTNIEDVELEFRTLWVTIHAKIDRLDAVNRIAYMDRTSGMRLSRDFHAEGAAYVVKNVFEALEEPGQWYLDRPAGTLYYLPMPGEEPETVEVVAPVLEEAVRIEGDHEAPKPVSTVRFEGLTFAHNEWKEPADYSFSAQAAHSMPGIVNIARAENIAFDRCSFAHTGTYGLHGEQDCVDTAVRRCTLTDLGAGGIKMWHGTKRTLVEDCHIYDGGVIDAAGVGVLMARSSGNRILHNHIHDFYYTGVSLGWCWNYSESQTYGNVIEWNHIHDLGKGRLSDMAGIYTLGAQPGTRLRYNHIHHVNCRTYGGSGIYPDEGSTHILIESNLVHDTISSAFYQHYGKENTVRNNIFAFDRGSHVMCQWGEEHVSFFFEGNIVYLGPGRLMHTKGNWTPQPGSLRGNLYYRPKGGGTLDFDGIALEELQAQGVDAGSRVADPKFVNAERRNFRLKKDSPALKLGFVPWDYRRCGPRNDEEDGG